MKVTRIMTTARQIAANRRNACLSTGPRTEEGKSWSRCNALKHGFRAPKVLLAGEDPDDYRRLQRELIAGHGPQDTLERELLERMTSVLWRLKRVPAFESALMAWVDACGRHATVFPGQPGYVYAGEQAPLELAFGRTIEKFLNSGLSNKLSRYESSLQRQFCVLLKELRGLKARRGGEAEGRYAALAAAAETSGET